MCFRVEDVKAEVSLAPPSYGVTQDMYQQFERKCDLIVLFEWRLDKKKFYRKVKMCLLNKIKIWFLFCFQV